MFGGLYEQVEGRAKLGDRLVGQVLQVVTVAYRERLMTANQGLQASRIAEHGDSLDAQNGIERQPLAVRLGDRGSNRMRGSEAARCTRSVAVIKGFGPGSEQLQLDQLACHSGKLGHPRSHSPAVAALGGRLHVCLVALYLLRRLRQSREPAPRLLGPRRG